MEEGRQIQAGNPAEASDKVVRLPRDWLGPREHLVPIARTTPPPLEEPAPDGFAPTADDFWGERSAAIHDVVEASEPPPLPDAPASAPRRSPRKGLLSRRRLAAAALAGVAAVAAAIVLLLPGSPRPSLGGARLNIAAILDTGVSKIQRINPPRIIPRGSVFRAVKHMPHRPTHPRTAPVAAHRHTSRAPTYTYVAHTTPAHTEPAYHAAASPPASRAYTSPPPAASPAPRRAATTASSGANVSPTGQSGALGPVQSPNG